MAYLIAQGGDTLYKVDLTTGTRTALTLPTGVTLSTTRKPRFTVLNQWVAMVNSPSRNLVIDPEGTVRVLVPRAPTHPPSVVAGSSTGLTGAYQYKYSYIVTNSDGELLMESPLSPPSASVTLADDDASLTDIAPSLDNISARRIYRTLSGGTEYFHVADIDGNVGTTFLDNVADEKVELLTALSDTLLSPPGTLPGSRFKLITQWKSRLWAVSDDPSLIDTVYATETNKVYAWPNQAVLFPVGSDRHGVNGFAVRKNQLGMLKRTGLYVISGTAGSSGISVANISVQQVAGEEAGSLSPDSTVTINDVVYYLGNDGVYEWRGDGNVSSITDATVAPWFKTDDYFNRSRFPNAFGRYNKLRNSYELHLAALGSSTEDRWVSFNLTTRKWYGPHKTGAFTPTHAMTVLDENGLPMTLVGGSDGVIYVGNQTTFRDGAATAIEMDVIDADRHGDAPDIEHHWGKLSVLSKIESAGTLTITPSLTVGGAAAAAGAAISHDQTANRRQHRIIGDGRLMRLRFQQTTVNQGASIYGYEVDNVHEIGRR
jgi:hypothetical protein